MRELLESENLEDIILGLRTLDNLDLFELKNSNTERGEMAYRFIGNYNLKTYDLIQVIVEDKQYLLSQYSLWLYLKVTKFEDPNTIKTYDFRD